MASSEGSGEYGRHPTRWVGWVEVVPVRKERIQVATLAALHEKPRRFRALPECLRPGFGSAVTGSKFPTTRLLIPKFRLVDSQSHDTIFRHERPAQTLSTAYRRARRRGAERHAGSIDYLQHIF
jgi:hypothetical protein